MEQLTVGGIGFALILIYDLFQVTGKERLSWLLSLIGYGMVSASVLLPLLSLRPSATPLPERFALIAFAAAAFLLLIYSVLFEIPLALKRSGRLATKPRKVVSVGFYAVVRHPGFLWFTLGLLALVLLYRRGGLIQIAAGLVLFDFILILIEDLILFPRIFTDYGAYKERVPFILPRISLRRQEPWRHTPTQQG